MKTILILEISESGHHPGYVHHILESVDPDNGKVLVAGTRNLVRHSELDSVRSRFTPIEIEVSESEKDRLNNFSTIGLIRRELCVRNIYKRIWRQAAQKQPIDIVILPFVDDCSNAFSLLGAPFGDTPWVGISMRTQFHFPDMGVAVDRRLGMGLRALLMRSSLRAWLVRRLLRQSTLKELLTIDPTLILYAGRQQATEFAKLRYLPDPTYTLPLMNKIEARSSLRIPADSKVILVYGALSERKGVTHLVRAMCLPDCPEKIHVILAGPQDDGVRALLETPSAASLVAASRLHIVSGYVSVPTVQMAQLLFASDAMWIGYVDFYAMSSVLVLAAQHGLPSITTQQGIVGYLSRLHSCGLPVDPRSESSILEVLQRIASGHPALDVVAENARNAFSDHSHAEFYRIMGDSVGTAGDTPGHNIHR